MMNLKTFCDGTLRDKKIQPTCSPVKKPDLIGTLHHYPSVPSLFINPRNVEIWLPSDYDEGNANGYAVLYMHDGQNLFESQKSFTGVDWGMDETMAALSRENEIRPTIVVAIWKTPQRLREYLPQRPFCNHQSQRSTSRVIKRYGGTPISDKYPHFLVHELKPLPGRHKLYLDYGNEVNNAGYRYRQKRVEQILKDGGYEFARDWLGNWYAGDPYSETAWRARVQVPLRFLLKNDQRRSETSTSTKGGARDA